MSSRRYNYVVSEQRQSIGRGTRGLRMQKKVSDYDAARVFLSETDVPATVHRSRFLNILNKIIYKTIENFIYLCFNCFTCNLD